METKIEKIDGYELGSFIKKLLPIDKFIFIKIDQENTVSSVYFPEKDAVKLVTVKTSELLTGSFDKPVKVSFYNGTKVVEALSHFNSDIRGKVKYSELDSEYMASDFIIENNDLRIDLACADPSLSFMELSKDEMSRAFSTDNAMFEFDLLTTHVDRMKSLFNLDKEDETFTVYINEKGVSVKGNSYDSLLTGKYEGSPSNGDKVVIYKKYLSLLDKENYKVIICENKVVFKSLDTDTLLTVAVAMVDED